MWGNSASPNLDGLERQLHHWRAVAREAAGRWLFRTFPHLAASFLEVAAAGFGPASIPHFFSTRVSQIAPSLNDDLLELYGRAGQVLINRFAFFNSSQAFDQGIDWEPRQTSHWRAELHAFDFGLDLACTLRISGEEVYARQLRYLMAHWIASNPPGIGTGWQPHVLARRVRNWMLSADFARDDWESDIEFKNLVAESLALQLAYLVSRIDSLPSPAARLDASRALLCASRYFQARRAWHLGFDLLTNELARTQAEPWPQARLEKAQTLMEWNLFSTSAADSGFRELKAALGELENVLMPGGEFPLLGPQARLAQDELADLAALAAVKFHSPAWKSIAGKFGILPYLLLGEPGKMQFESLEQIEWTPEDHLNETAEILRLAGPHASTLMVSARLPTAPGDHQDFTSYELTLNGHRVIVDSGGFTPEEHKYFSCARAHNILLVDGREPRWQCAEDSARVDLSFNAGNGQARLADPGFQFLGVQHERAWFRVDENSWLVLDRLAGRGSHRSTSLIHFYPTFQIAVGTDRVVAKSRASMFAVIPVGAAKPHVSHSRGDHPQFPGWFSPEFGVKFPSAVLTLDWTGVELPWMGGALITSSGEGQLRQLEITPSKGRVRLEFCGKTYDWIMK